MIKKSLVAGLMSLAAGSAFADAHSHDFSYDYVEGSYSMIDAEGIDYSAFNVIASKSITDSVYVQGSYIAAESDDKFEGENIEIDDMRIGVGYHHPINAHVDGFASFSIGQLDASLGDFEADSDVLVLTGGVRAVVYPQVEVTGAVSYVDTDESSDVAFNGQARYYVTDEVSLVAGVEFSDSDALTFGARYDF